MAIVNPLLNIKDSRWLQLEVCREFQRNKCTRSDTECKFAHPSSNVEIQNGRVIACYDSMKGRCNREKPPCKYFHPPKHLKEQLIINGKNHLALKNAILQQVPFQTVLAAGQLPLVGSGSNLLNAAYQRNVMQQAAASVQTVPSQSIPSHSTQVHTNLVHPMTAAFASALNGSTTSILINPNHSMAKAPNPYLTNLSALAAASPAYGPYTPAATAAMIVAPEQFNSFGLIPSSSASTGSATNAVNNLNPLHNQQTAASINKSRTINNVSETTGSVVTANNSSTITSETLESHGLNEAASSINAIANAAAVAAAAIGRKRPRDSNDDLLMNWCSIEISLQSFMDSNNVSETFLENEATRATRARE
ncbi:uncharacterized protein NH340_JMT06305 [Sarcoptes scabiei]|nr:uncharacterized protein NH340_JMT06305 [Sarcoptes scabiei]